MAQYQVKPPEKFSFKAEDWTKWIKRFERFRIASGLETQADENQVNALIYGMGEEAEDILVSLHLTPEQACEYDTVKQRLDAHFVARRNVIFERAKFNQRQQEMGESADSFITALHCLAEHWIRHATRRDGPRQACSRTQRQTFIRTVTNGSRTYPRKSSHKS